MNARHFIPEAVQFSIARWRTEKLVWATGAALFGFSAGVTAAVIVGAGA